MNIEPGKSTRKATDCFRVIVSNRRSYFIDILKFVRSTRPHWMYFDGARVVNEIRFFRRDANTRFAMALTYQYLGQVSNPWGRPTSKKWFK
jgi:hypothetical protein